MQLKNLGEEGRHSSGAEQYGYRLDLNVRTVMQFFDWHYRSCRQNWHVCKERAVDAIHFGPVRNLAYVDRALHDVCDHSFRGFNDGSNVFERLCCFLGERALYEIAGTIKRQLPRDEEKIAHAHRLRVVAARLRCGLCFDGFVHRNWRTEANPEHSDKWLVVSEAASALTHVCPRNRKNSPW